MGHMKSHLFRLTGLFRGGTAAFLGGIRVCSGQKIEDAEGHALADGSSSSRLAWRRGLWRAGAEATIKREKFELRLVRRVADDWELSIAGKQPLTVVRKDGDYCLSDDDGKTWRQALPSKRSGVGGHGAADECAERG